MAVTRTPTQEWRKLRNATKVLPCNRDHKFGENAVRAPNMNAWQNVSSAVAKARCSDHVLLLDDRDLDSLSRHSDARPRQGIGQWLPDHHTREIDTSRPSGTRVLGGLHADYRRAA